MSVRLIKIFVKDCFVTGKWGQSEDAEELLKMDEEDEEEVYGDFEDLETGKQGRFRILKQVNIEDFITGKHSGS